MGFFNEIISHKSEKALRPYTQVPDKKNFVPDLDLSAFKYHPRRRKWP
jgi:hypothetical protein